MKHSGPASVSVLSAINDADLDAERHLRGLSDDPRPYCPPLNLAWLANVARACSLLSAGYSDADLRSWDPPFSMYVRQEAAERLRGARRPRGWRNGEDEE